MPATESPPPSPPSSPEVLAPRRRLALFGGIFLVALALRFAYVFEIWPHPAAQLPILDAEAYRKTALEIRAGDWLGDSVYYLDPLYPFFLAAIYSIVEPDTRGVLLAQAFLDSLSVLILMLVARRAFGDRAALATGALAATYSLFFYFDGLLQKEALMIFLMVSALALSLRAAQGDRPRAWLPAGLLVGLAALTRGNSLLFAPALLLWIGLAGRGSLPRRALAGLLFGLGVASILLPVAVRNQVVGGDFVLLNSQAGQNFYIGNFRGNATGAYVAPPFLRPNPEVEEEDFANEARRRTGRDDLSPSEISSFWMREGFAEIAADPGHFVRHLGRKLLVFANRYEIPDNSSVEYFQRYVSRLLSLPFPGWSLVFPLAVAGMWLGRTNRLAWILMLFFASYTAGLLLFFNLSRMRLPVVPVAIVFAGFALAELFERARRKDLRGLALPIALALALVPLTRIDLPRQPLNIRFFNLGTGFLRRSEAAWTEGLARREAGDEAGAREAFARALEARSDAEDEFARGLAEFPSFERLRSALRVSMHAHVRSLELLEDDGPALEAALALTKRFDRYPPGFVELGEAYERLGRADEARAAFRRALRLAPGSPEAAAGLARVESTVEPAPAND
jgi:4-amino-4-deoxy-L-arabinose transferase-like glycosyltransferase